MIPILPESNPFFREDAAGFKHNERNKQSVSQKKLTKRIIRQTAQAITDFSMIEEGDKVMVAMSGGKDSYVLLDALRTLQKRAPISFELLAVTVNPHIPQFPAETLRAYFEAEGVPYHIEDQDIYSIIQKLIPEGKSVCSLCARLRRGVLYRLAGELGCTKIALGHHMDDIVGTLLLNLFYGGRFKCFHPHLYLSRTRMRVIRPFVYIEERQIRLEAERLSLPVISSCCPYGDKSKRKSTKEIVAALEREVPELKSNIVHALRHLKENESWPAGMLNE